ncbi:LysR family transcriptional regulator [uncultured Megasphaera sp.]|uniref:LysR family transcriptional regulator n=1 Tax=uncultured Megasphaera sp. TaxID=165188 RepID=UPI0026586CB6|nr:LysR family transcriptional regulator [uncultured Megasphaera sp.]
MDIRQLTYFIAVAEEGQITAAARRLHMAQPPLSQQIQKLEAELGVSLFDRKPRRMQLTDAGKILLRRAQQMLILADSTQRELMDFKEGLHGTLNIGTVSSSGSIILRPSVAQFHRQYRGVRFEIYEGNTYDIIEMLTKGLIEIGIVRTPFPYETFHCKFLQEEPMSIALNEELDWFPTAQEVTIPDLSGQPLIIYRRFDQLIHETCAAYNVTPTIFCRSDDARTSLLWANAGLGIAVIPQSAFTLGSYSHLHQKILREPRLYTHIAAIWMKNRYLSSLAEKFIESFS